MKRWLTLVCSAALLLALLPMGAFSVPVAAQEESVIVNVKDFGAVGDGQTDDRTAIMEAFYFALTEYMVDAVPVTVYFPEGQYGLLNGGMYIYLPRGYGNLTVKGDGADKSTIVYLDEWNSSGSWVALRIQPKITPESEEQYLHDITIQDLGVYDTDPDKHAWHVDKGDPSSEETHGVNIQYCVRATIKNCKAVDVGDECFDMSHCIDSLITENEVVKNRITGNGGGSLSVGDGSRNVTITDNVVMFDTDSDSASHYGIAVEALAEHVHDIYITHNTVRNINGWGVSIGAPNGTTADILVQENTLTDCHEGGIRLMGLGRSDGTQLLDNYISKVRIGILVDGSNKMDTLIDGCVIENVSNYAINVKSPSHYDTVVRNTVLRNNRWRAIYNAGTNTLVDRVLVDGSGTAGNVSDSAVIQYTNGGDCTISNSVFLNCQNKRGIQGVARVINTYIQQPEISGYTSIVGSALIQNCWVNRIVTIKSGFTVDNLTLYTREDPGTHAIIMTNLTDCIVKDCRITIPSRYAISEAGTADNNTITNNVVVGGSGIKTVGANTVVSGNIRATESATEQFRYRVVDGEATLAAWLDTDTVQAVLPSEVEGYPVTAIDPWAFALNENLTSILIPESISAIGANAFFGCDGLTEVHYPGTVAQWDAIDIGVNNDALTDGGWHCPSDRYDGEVAHSVMDTAGGNGLAFRFTLYADGVAVDENKQVVLTGATVNYLGVDCKLVSFGAVVTNHAAVGQGNLTLAAVNGSDVRNVPAVYLQETAADSCAFAIRVVDIPDEMKRIAVYARPYYVIEVGSEQVTVYGDMDVASCVEYM